jgi:tetratricopeptide (TPR) repeat protein
MSKTPAKPKISPVITIAFLIVLGFAVYGNSLHGTFLYDDYILIKHNGYIKDWSNIPKIFITDVGRGGSLRYHYYRPFILVTYLIDYSLYRLNEVGYHITNILIHIFVAGTVYWLISILFNNTPLAFLTSCLFVIHPIHTSSVAYMSGRGDPLSALFALLAFIFYLKIHDARNLVFYVLMMLCYVIALLSKENSLILPALVLLYHYTFKKRLKINLFLSIAGLSFIFVFLRLTLVRNFLPLPHLASHTPLLQRIPGFFIAIATYFKLLLLPFSLHMEYGNKLFNFANPGVIGGFFIVLSLLLYGWKVKEGNKVIFFSIFWFFIALLPAANIYPVRAYMSEQWVYLPSIGFFLLVAHGLWYLCRTDHRKIAAAILIVAIGVYYSYLTIRQNYYWKGPIHFYKKTLAYAPGSWKMHDGLGNAYKETGKIKEAITSFKKALELNPDFVGAYINLGIAYRDIGKGREAIATFKKAQTIDPDYPATYCNLGIMHYRRGKNKEAIAAFQKTLALDPDHPAAYNNLGVAYGKLGRHEKAIELFNKAVTIDPDYAEAYSNLALTYYYKQDYERATLYFNEAKELGLVNPVLSKALGR